MPRSTDNYHPHPPTQFTQITIAEMQALHVKKASSLQIKVFLVLKTYCWGKDFCFPSLQSICERLQYKAKSAQQRVCEALRWLDQNGFIVRGHHRDKPNRFIMKRVSAPAEIKTSAKTEQKKTQLQVNSQTPTPLEKGEMKEEIEKAQPVSKQQRVRAHRRRKRLRRSDLQLINEVATEARQQQQRHKEQVQAYTEAIERTPDTLERLFDDYACETKHKPARSPRTAYMALYVLFHYGWIDTPPAKPPEIQQLTDILTVENQALLWELRLDWYSLKATMQNTNGLP